MIPWLSISSSWVDAAHYDQGDLYLRFKTGVICHYANVGVDLWLEFLNAPSKGAWVNERLAKPKWPYEVL